MLNEVLDQGKITALVENIKKKKELQSIADDFVEQCLVKYLNQEPKLLKLLQEKFNPKSKAYVLVIKNVRSQLRRVYGLFRDDPQERKILIEKLLISPRQKRSSLLQQILSTHSSTQERLSIYEQLYSKIFALSGKPKTILDLGCGINPFSFPYLKLKECTYYAYDLIEEEIEAINNYFALVKKENPSFIGKALVADILAETLPKADLCFLFKITDVIDQGKKQNCRNPDYQGRNYECGICQQAMVRNHIHNS